jgi:hypothetical protein
MITCIKRYIDPITQDLILVFQDETGNKATMIEPTEIRQGEEYPGYLELCSNHVNTDPHFHAIFTDELEPVKKKRREDIN